MNGNGYDTEDIDLESVGDYEYDEELAFLEDDIEARRPNQRRRPVPTGQGAGYYRQPPAHSYVTQAQLQSALSKISKDVKSNAAGIKGVNSRVDAISTEQKRQMVMLKKNVTESNQKIEKLKSGIQMASILPLITSKTVTVPAASSAAVFGKAVTEDTKLQVAPSGISALLPMFLMGDGMGGGDSSNMIFMALALGGGL
jgi:hypothetical protein